MNKSRVFFDTNVLIYAHDQSAIYHRDSAELLKLAVDNEIQGVLAEQNIIELYRILTNSAAMSGTPLTPQQARTLYEQDIRTAETAIPPIPTIPPVDF